MKIIIIYYDIPTRTAKIKGLAIQNMGQDRGQVELGTLLRRRVSNSQITVQNSLSVSCKVKHTPAF